MPEGEEHTEGRIERETTCRHRPAAAQGQVILTVISVSVLMLSAA